jgi:MFS family permease
MPLFDRVLPKRPVFRKRRLAFFEKGAAAMLAILILGAGVGVVLGLRFTVFALVLITLFAAATVIITGLGSHDDARAVGYFALAVMASLQFGYFIGGLLAEYFGERGKSRRFPWKPRQYF